MSAPPRRQDVERARELLHAARVLLPAFTALDALPTLIGRWAGSFADGSTSAALLERLRDVEAAHRQLHAAIEAAIVEADK